MWDEMVTWRYIDAHVHANSRSVEDFERLKGVGCAGLVALAGPEAGFSSSDSVLDHFRRLANVDRPRIERCGLACHLALGIHPAGIPGKDVDALLAQLPEILEHLGAVALGEIGLERGGELEERVLLAQLQIAAHRGLAVVLHTPRLDKQRLLDRSLEILQESGLPGEKVLLDHLDEAVLPGALSSGCFLGLSVHPSKLKPQEAAELVQANPGGRFVLTSDLGAHPSYLFGIPAAISAMEDLGVDSTVLRAVAHDHAARWLGIHS